jgi:acid phosphatase
MNIYAPPAAARLNALLPDVNFNWTAADVFAAQSLCGYETAARGESEFCNLFREEEWLGFEYGKLTSCNPIESELTLWSAANDVKYHRQLGYGSTLAPSLGIPWLAASARLLSGAANGTAPNSSATSQSLWISFTHREEPPFVVTALGLFNTTNASMPATAINYERAWRTSEILPFLANVALEAISCNNTAGGNSTATQTNAAGPAAEVYVRALVNQAPIPIPGCSEGPGASCPLASFTDFIARTCLLSILATSRC